MIGLITIIAAFIGVLLFVIYQYKEAFSALKSTINNVSNFTSDMTIGRKINYKYKRSPNSFPSL